MRLARSFVAGLALLAMACDSKAGLSGVWTGTSASSVSFYLTITETPQGAVSGGGRVNNTLVTVPATVTGAHAHPAVSLAISASGFQAMNFSGSLDASLSRLNGVLYGSGFTGDSLKLARVTPAVASQLTGP